MRVFFMVHHYDDENEDATELFFSTFEAAQLQLESRLAGTITRFVLDLASQQYTPDLDEWWVYCARRQRIIHCSIRENE